MQVLLGILLPFVGTALGAAAIWLMPGGFGARARNALHGFAAGVMTAASVWSLLLPAIAQSADLHGLSFLPAVAGFWLGVGLLLLLDRTSDRLLAGTPSLDSGTRRMMFAIVLHNLPEGVAVGVAFAGVLAGSAGVTMAGATALSLGIAIQNLPEGAIVSLPLHAAGLPKSRAWLYGVLSGAVEPVGAALTLAFAQILTPALPYLLSFAAGAMLLVVVQELCPAISRTESRTGLLLFSLGFTLMMALDVALG